MEKIPSINGLRGLAVMAIIYYHALSVAVVAYCRGGSMDMLVPFVSNEWTAVNLFFILSGFVLYLPYARRRRIMATWGDAWSFYKRRFLRLMPLYYTAAAVVLVIFASKLSAAAFAEAAFDLLTVMRLALSPDHFIVQINYALWSVGVEVLFSLVFPLLVMIAARTGWSRLLAVALGGALLVRIIGRIWDPHLYGPNFISDNLFGRIDEFIIGMLLAKLYAEDRLPLWAPRLAWPGIGLVLLSWEVFHQFHDRYVVLWAVANNPLDLGFALLIAAALVRERRSPGVLGAPPLQLLGMMCYSLYIWHVPLLLQVRPTQGLMFTVVLLAVLAAFSYRYVEFGQVRDWKALFLWPDVVLPGRRGRILRSVPAPRG